MRTAKTTSDDMTLTEFLLRLRHTPREWEQKYDGAWRLLIDGEEACPVSSLAWRDADHWLESAEEIGLDYDLADRLQEAADFPDGTDEMRRLRGMIDWAVS